MLITGRWMKSKKRERRSKSGQPSDGTLKPAPGFVMQPLEETSKMNVNPGPADEMGVRVEIEELLALIDSIRFPCPPYPRCVMCSLPSKKTQALLTFWMRNREFYLWESGSESLEKLFHSSA